MPPSKASKTPGRSLQTDCLGNWAEQRQAKRVGGVAVMSRHIASGGEILGEEEAQEGSGPWQVLNPPAWETDSQGEQSREVGQRHPPHLLEVQG